MEVGFFYPFGRTDYDSCMINAYNDTTVIPKDLKICLFYDQEPLLEKNIHELIENISKPTVRPDNVCMFGNSEISEYKTELCATYNFVDFYYFFHGLLCTYWFSDVKYFKHINHPIKNDFLAMNHLCTNDRSYRLTLVAELIENNLIDKGSVSLHLFSDANSTVKQELFNFDSKLSKYAKKLIYKNITPLTDNLTIDTEQGLGQMSADFDHGVYEMWQSSFFHIVTETVFYYDKLHLTEKIFKPIVASRPFILCAAPGNLAYLKSYGFKTFDRWIDESYDLESDHDTRIKKIVAEVKRITELSANDKEKMYIEMLDVLNYNFNHFFNEFKEIVVDELLENFKLSADQLNLQDNNQKFDLTLIDFQSVRNILCQ
tara:strand:+ start:4038 stop:5156 length:1119 start_codon:yes stop_codon:yes gene_type:complete